VSCVRARRVAVNGVTRYPDPPDPAPGPNLPVLLPAADPTPLDPLPRVGAAIGAADLLLKDETGPPTWSYQALDAVRSTGGAARTVGDAAALAARALVGEPEGRLLELSSAAAVGAAGAAIADGTIDRGHRVVVIGTSSGLKDPLAGLDAASPAAVSATLETTLAYVGAQR
jgi:hypothetical protein